MYQNTFSSYMNRHIQNTQIHKTTYMVNNFGKGAQGF